MKKFPLLLLPAFLVWSPLSPSAASAPTYRFPETTGFLREWLICGPFPNAAERGFIDFRHGRQCDGFFRDCLLPQGGERQVSPSEGDSLADSETGKRYTWRRILSDTDLISFENLFTPNNLVVAYAFCLIETENETPAVLSLGSNDGIRVFLNGEMVHEFHIDRWLGKDIDLVPVTLKRGANRLLIKVDEGSGDWGFSARLRDHATVLKEVGDNIERHKKLTVATYDDDLSVAFGEPYQISILNPGAQVRVQVRDSTGQVKGLLSGPPGHKLLFPLFAFEEGPLQIRAEFPLPSGEIVVSELAHYKGPLPRHSPPANLGADLAVRREGKPFFPIGCYGAQVGDYPLLKEVGYNFVVAPLEHLDEVHKAGLLAAVPFHGDDSAYLAHLEEAVRKYKDHPAVLCWMLADEPEFNRLNLMGIHRAYELVHTIDGVHPTYLVITDPRGYETYGRCCDVLAVDTYPISRRPIANVGAYIAQARRSSDGDLPIWHCGQMFAWPSDRPPTPDEHRYMSYLALLEGVKGMLWFAHRYQDFHVPTSDPALWEAQKRLLAELRELEPFWLAEGRGQSLEVKSRTGKVRAVLRADGKGRRLVLAVNSATEEGDSATIALPSEVQASSCAVHGEDRRIPLSGNVLKDEFQPLGVRIYLIE
ncbi:MAG: hypothetical protein HUU16_01335 [Candidatus Omnitrophica bacterium]|nr:hypothetical protein [bacterium]NUN94789.1 hypothetical protein [Candidatus Omnitrophota bacterium]